MEIEGRHEGGIEFVDGKMLGEFVSEDGKVEEEDVLVEEDLADVFWPVEGCVQEPVEVVADVHLLGVFGCEEEGLSQGDVSCHADPSCREGAGKKPPRALGEAEIEGGDEADVGEDDFPLEDGESQEGENPPASAPVGVEDEREQEIGAGIGQGIEGIEQGAKAKEIGKSKKKRVDAVVAESPDDPEDPPCGEKGAEVVEEDGAEEDLLGDFGVLEGDGGVVE